MVIGMVKAAVFEKANEPLVLREFPRPQVEENAVLAKILSAGICGTDIHVWSGKVPWVKCPVILGHESVGVVEELGKIPRQPVSEGAPITVPPLVTRKPIPATTEPVRLADIMQEPGAI